MFNKKKDNCDLIKGNVDGNDNYTLKAKNQEGLSIGTFIRILEQDEITSVTS